MGSKGLSKDWLCYWSTVAQDPACVGEKVRNAIQNVITAIPLWEKELQIETFWEEVNLYSSQVFDKTQFQTLQMMPAALQDRFYITPQWSEMIFCKQYEKYTGKKDQYLYHF